MKLASRAAAALGIVLLSRSAAALAGQLDGATPAEARALAQSTIPVLLPEVPPAFGVAYAATSSTRSSAPGGYVVWFSGPAGSFSVTGYRSKLEPTSWQDEQKTYRVNERRALRGVSLLFRSAAGTRADGPDPNGCTTVSSVLRQPSDIAVYEVRDCGSLSPDGLKSVASSMRTVANSAPQAPARTAAGSASAMLSEQQRAGLRATRVPVVLYSWLPGGMRLRSVESSARRGPGGTGYAITFGDGNRTLSVESTGGLGGADVPIGSLFVPVSTHVFGSGHIVPDPDDRTGRCLGVLTNSTSPFAEEGRRSIDASSFFIAIPGGNVRVSACGVPPYAFKRAVESLHVVRV